MSDVEMLDNPATKLPNSGLKPTGPPDDGSEPASDEGDGDDINAMSDDSSEEAATDEEEVKKLRQDFIVDDDEEEADSDGDDEEERQRKRRKRRRKHGLSLDADDLALVEENTGTRMSSRKEFSRIRRGRASPDGEDSAPGQSKTARGLQFLRDLPEDDESDQEPDINHIFDDQGRSGRGGAGGLDEMDLDDDEAFIDDEDDDDDGEMGEEEREQRRREKRRSEKQRRRALDARPELAGIDAGAWDEIYDVFGNGDDYDWALDEDEDDQGDNEFAQKDMRYQDVFEPSEIAARFLTSEDDVIRATDIPERMQLTTSSLSPHAALSTSLDVLSSSLPTEEMRAASEWVTTRLSSRIREEFFLATGKYHHYLEDLILAVSTVLKHIVDDKLEVPYIWTHKRDYISVSKPGQPRVPLLEREDLWKVQSLASRYRALYARKKVLIDTYTRMASMSGVSDSYFEIDILSMMNSVDAVTDAMEWLSMTYKKQYDDALEFGDDEVGGSKDPVQVRLKKPSRVTPYDIAKNSTISVIASRFFGIPLSDIVKNVADNQKRWITEDPDTTPLKLAEEFLEETRTSRSPEEVLHTARMIIATELGKNPQLRQITRDRFRAAAVITVKPTEKGLNKIDGQHPYTAFKYLLNKPVEAMLNDAQWLHILSAEADHLITVHISLDVAAEQQFRQSLANAFESDGFSDVAKAWNNQRAIIIEDLVENYLYSVGVKHVREWLKDEVEERLATKCTQVLEDRIDVAPFRPKEFEKGDPPSVLALSWGKGDPQKDAIYVVFMDEHGVVREHLKFDNLMDPSMRAEFLELIKRRKPEVITLGGFSVLTIKLWDRVREVLGYEELDDSSGGLSFQQQEADAAYAKANPNHNTSQRALNPLCVLPSDTSLVPVIWTPDHVARIFQHSKRATEELGSLPPIGRYCAGLARYVQNPLNEFAALGADIVAISFHDDQQLLPPERLLAALERALVNIVNEVGVDVNKVVTDGYYRLLLPFVAGLGPRKAQALLKKITQLGGTVTNREQFITQGLMTKQIFINASGFLKITQDEYDDRGRGYDSRRTQDPLDATRIHPEDYELARKMASGALELDEEDMVNQHPSAAVVQLMQDDNNGRLLQSLGLDEFAESLWDTNNERKRYTLDMILQEILNPFAERRHDFDVMRQWEVIAMLTGESRKTLIPGRILTVTVARIRDEQVAVRLESGIEGSINQEYLTNEGTAANSAVRLRQTLQAVITRTQIGYGPRLRVQLAARPDAIKQAEEEHKTHLDKYYDVNAAKAAQEFAERKQRNEANRTRRIIKHPAFKNLGSSQAEEYLAPMQHGDAVIRPSSKGPEHLAVTWKVADGIYQHIDVIEPNADQPNAAATQYIVDNEHRYSDLDDLLVNHVKAMSRKVDDLMASEKFKGGSDNDLQNWLTNFVKMNPNRSSYAFGLNRARPGFFNLSFLANINSPVQTWLVKVTPTAYRLGDVAVGSVPDLCDAFKRKHQKDMRTLANGGKTPYGAGRATPGRATGMTPGYGTNYAKTPNAYTGNTARTPAWPAGLPPNPKLSSAVLASMTQGNFANLQLGPGPGNPNFPPQTPSQQLPAATPLRTDGPPSGVHPDRWRQMQGGR